MKSNRKGLSVMGVVQIVFIILKLCNVISWSWWLVLIPLFLELIVLVFGFMIYYWLS